MKTTITLILALVLTVVIVQTSPPNADIKGNDVADNENAGNSDASHVNIIDDFRAGLHALTSYLQKQVEGVRNRVKRLVLLNISRQLQNLNARAVAAKERVQQLTTKWTADILREEQSIEQGWNTWASEKLSNVAVASNGNAKTMKEAEALINEYVNRCSNDLSSCSDKIFEEFQGIEKQVQIGVGNYKAVVGKLNLKVQDCLQSEDSNSAGRQCSRAVREELRKLRRAVKGFVKLSLNGGHLLVAAGKRRSCVVSTQAQFELEKLRIEQSIRKLLDDAANEDASSSSTSGLVTGGSVSSSTESAIDNSSVDSADSDQSKESNSESSVDGRGAEEDTNASDISDASNSN